MISSIMSYKSSILYLLALNFATSTPTTGNFAVIYQTRSATRGIGTLAYILPEVIATLFNPIQCLLPCVKLLPHVFSGVSMAQDYYMWGPTASWAAYLYKTLSSLYL